MLMLFSITYVLPVVTSLIYGDGQLLRFVSAALVCFGCGAALWGGTRHSKRELRSRDGFMLVSLGWALMSAIATVPLLMALPDLSFTDAFFETMSGLSTTGATVLVGLDYLPPSINLWRHALCWYGGMGIIVLVVAILPLLGVGGMQLYKAETPGPVKNEKLTPRITQTAKALWFIYFLITVACILSLKVAGMNWFDAVCHAFAAMALGGFSTHDASVGYYNSVPIEFVLIVFMLIAAMNFARHFIAWQQKSLRTYATDSEAKAMLTVIGLSIARALALRLVRGCLCGVLRVPAPRRLQPGVDRDGLRIREPGLRRVAGVRADVDPDAVVLLRERGLDRRRHQDVPNAGAVPPGRS